MTFESEHMLKVLHGTLVDTCTSNSCVFSAQCASILKIISSAASCPNADSPLNSHAGIFPLSLESLL